jgi:hypothetical protein
MSNFQEKWLKASVAILEATQQGEISWIARPPSDSFAADLLNMTEQVYIGSYKNAYLRIYEKEVEVADMPDSTLPEFFIILAGKSKTRKIRKTFLDFCTGSAEQLWTVPDSKILPDLLQAVRYRHSGAQTFLEQILREQGNQENESK